MQVLVHPVFDIQLTMGGQALQQIFFVLQFQLQGERFGIPNQNDLLNFQVQPVVELL
jgi:hypothetical protein